MLWGTRNYLVQLLESFVYFIYFVYLSFLVYYETLRVEKGEGRVRGVRSRCPMQSLHRQGWKDPLHSLDNFPSSWNISSLWRLIPAWHARATISTWTWTLSRFIYINQQVILKLKCTSIVNRIPSIYSKWTLESTRNWNYLSLVVSLLCIKN